MKKVVQPRRLIALIDNVGVEVYALAMGLCFDQSHSEHMGLSGALPRCFADLCMTFTKQLPFVHSNNKGEDQPAHPHSLIYAFVISVWKV